MSTVIPEKPETKKTSQLAERWLEIRKQELELEAERAAITEVLMKRMLFEGTLVLKVTKSEGVQLISDKRRDVTKGRIIEFFGKKGEEFWEQIPEKPFEYLSLIKLE